jgi:hypothetical protein
MNKRKRLSFGKIPKRQPFDLVMVTVCSLVGLEKQMAALQPLVFP